MILVFNNNPELKKITVALAKMNAFEALDRSLRTGFDNATSISVAEGYIKAALELERYDLAEEMTEDIVDILSSQKISA